MPNFEDYRDDPDVRRGFNASVSAFQLADVMHTFYREEDPSKISQWANLVDFHSYLERIAPPFWITVQSVATAYKHLRISRSQYVIGSPAAVWALTLPSDPFDLELSYDRPEVMVRYRDGSREVSLTDALTEVVQRMWPQILPPET